MASGSRTRCTYSPVPRVSGLAVNESVEENGFTYTLFGGLRRGIYESRTQNGRKSVQVYQNHRERSRDKRNIWMDRFPDLHDVQYIHLVKWYGRPMQVIVVWQVEDGSGLPRYLLGQK